MTQRAHALIAGGLSLALALCLVGCAATTTAGTSATATPQPAATSTATPQATATPQPPCVQLVPGAAPFSGVSGAAGLMLPAGAYISSGAYGGGGAGQYHVTSYTACFHGAQSAINGPSGSTLSNLGAAGWTLGNLFPDSSNFSYLDFCSAPRNCVNKGGSGSPFTFISLDQYATHTGGYTTFTIRVASIGAPSCLNDSQYYSGTPKYTLYYDGNGPGPSGNPWDHFQMPPATRVSVFQGGGTAGSTYVYYCSAGTQASVVAALKSSFTNTGWSISNATASGFSAKYGSNPTYAIDVNVPNPNNYSLRVFIPM